MILAQQSSSGWGSSDWIALVSVSVLGLGLITNYLQPMVGGKRE